jgi:hypothetical protein
MAYSTISKPGLYFNTVTYSGTGSAQSITGVGFRPDWLWIKHRENGSNHKLQDVVRGSTKVIGSNEQAAEATVTQGVTSFDSDGFSLGTDASVNGTGSAGIVAWNWLAGGSQGSSNTDGSINTTYTSANTTAGFSISLYTGTGSAGTIGHGLGSTPKMMIVKCTSNSDTWAVYHVKVGATKYMELDASTGEQTSTVPWNDTAPTNSVFTVGNWSATNGSGRTYVAYCFAEKTGYSKFGEYTGNGNADGAFIYTGFRPAWVLGKRTDSSNNWFLFDNKRDPSNLTQRKLRPDTSAAENNNSSKAIDIYSNGFKIKNSDAEFNASGGTYIYMAFAEEPLVANVGQGIPATAR